MKSNNKAQKRSHFEKKRKLLKLQEKTGEVVWHARPVGTTLQMRKSAKTFNKFVYLQRLYNALVKFPGTPPDAAEDAELI